MKTYRLTIERSAERALRRVERRDRTRIENKIESLATEPRPADCTKLSGADAYRVRVGNYRVVYTISDTVNIVNVTNIGHRRDIYREV